MVKSVLFLLVLFFFTLISQSYAESMFKKYNQMNLTQGTGPESLAFDCNGVGPYIGISDGRILKWEEANESWKEFAILWPFRNKNLCDGSTDSILEPVCGRALGLEFNAETCDLYIADAYSGLLVVGPYGGIARKLATSAEGIAFKFTNGLDVDSTTGMIYFTDSSTIYERREVDSLLNDTTERSGRLLKYNPFTRQASVLYKDLAFPNGVALSADNLFLLVTESKSMRVLKFNLEGDDEATTPEVFAELPRVPDNVKRNENGEFWVALNTGRSGTSKDNAPDPIGIKFNEEGKILKRLDGEGAITFNSISEINEFNGKLFIGSVTKPYVGVLDA